MVSSGAQLTKKGKKVSEAASVIQQYALINLLGIIPYIRR